MRRVHSGVNGIGWLDVGLSLRLNGGMSTRLRCLFVACAAFVMAGESTARDLHVPGDASSVPAAVKAAKSGDRILVGPGRWTGIVDPGGKAITIESTDGPGRTVLDATGLGSVLRLVSGEGPRTVVRGFRLTGGVGDAGLYDAKARVGGGVVIVGGSPVIDNCIIAGNSASYRGGGLFAARSSCTISNCAIEHNASEKGGGVYFFGGTPTIKGGSLSFNEALYGGGGVFIDRSKVDIDGVLFDENVAQFSGGGMAVLDARPSVSNSRFLNNRAGQTGGAVHLGWGASMRQHNNQFVQRGDNITGGSSGRLRAVKGACCFGDMCIEVLETACIEAGGRWEGPGTDCVNILAARCEAARPGDLDRNETVDIRDLGRLLQIWGDLKTPAPTSP